MEVPGTPLLSLVGGTRQKKLDITRSRDKIQTILYNCKQRTGALSVNGISESCRRVQDSSIAAQLARELWS